MKKFDWPRAIWFTVWFSAAVALCCYLYAQAPQPQPENTSKYGVNNVLELPPERGEHTVIILRVIDGDTAVVAFLVPAVVRLKGINTPEREGATKLAGDAARTKLLELLPLDSRTDLTVYGREKYGRLLGEFRNPECPSPTINDTMISSGHAKPYSGGSRQ